MKRRFKSIYTRFFIIFLSAIFLANILSASLVYYTKVDDVKALIKEDLNEKVNLINFLVEEKNMTLDEIKEYSESFHINIEEIKMPDIEMDKINNNNIVFKEGKFTLPFYITKIGDSYIKISPSDFNNQMKQFRIFQLITFLIFMIIGTFFIIIGVTMIVKPIKKIAGLTKEVANGNFDVELKSRGNDEIAQLTDNFNKMVTQLKGNEYLRKDFVSSVSHEFKTPITSIKGFAKILKNETLSSEEKNEYINIIIAESERLSNLSTNLLKLSELDSKSIITTTEISLDEQLRQVVLLFQEKWEEKNIQMNIDLDEAKISGDEDLLYQVWVNLISNAIKFSKEGDSIDITLKREDRIKIIISDSGIGIQEEDKEKIFERFYKADKSRTKEGTGLGLSIVKKILNLHQSNIYIKSEYGKGTTFFVEFLGNTDKIN